MHNSAQTYFLRQVAEELLDDGSIDPFSTCFIFPSRRSANVFFQHYAELKASPSFISPAIETISEFVHHYCGLSIPDSDVLLLKLHEVYQKHWPQELKLEEFQFWGQMMLNDFNEIDKYCVDARQLYTIIRDEKQIEQQFSIEKELRELLSQFWFNVNDERAFEKEFLLTWELLGKVYAEFRESLLSEGLAYDGLAYRHLLQEIKSDKIQLPFSQICFIGFNAFTLVEEQLVKALSARYEIQLFWDTDTYYMDKVQQHEAGHFLRHYRNSFAAAKQAEFLGNSLSAGRKFSFHGAAHLQGQVQVAKSLLDENFDGTTVVVLCDETMLDPLLHLLKDTDRLNITMGKKIGQSPLSEFLDLLYRIFAFDPVSRRDLERLSTNVYYEMLVGGETSDSLKNYLSNVSRFYFGVMESVKIAGLASKCNKRIEQYPDMISLWLDVLSALKEIVVDKELHPDQKSMIQAFADVLLTRRNILEPYTHLGMEASHNLLWPHIKSLSIPYRTDASSKIQIMGFLETRLMDYDRVIVLGANEKNLPSEKKSHSYIPYNLRRVFGLPTLQEYDGVYAYHFFRLLQRSKEAHLVYNNTPGDNMDFEKSRFLEQIKLELDTPENQQQFFNWTYANSSSNASQSLIVVEKTEESIEKLKQRAFSQSALSLYLKCPVQFYLQYVVKLGEPDTVEEILDAGTFGTILHNTIESLYTDLIGKQISEADFTSKLSLIVPELRKSFEKENIKYDDLGGENLLAHDVIKASIEKLILSDAQLIKQEKFIIVGLESEREQQLQVELADGSFQTINFMGKIDRLDRVFPENAPSYPRILDYKTGKVDLKDKDITPEIITTLFQRHNDKLKKQLFQGLFYRFLVGEEDASVGFYSLRKINDGIVYLNESRPILHESLNYFVEELRNLMQEILDKETPFTQNPSPEAYTFSPYTFIAPVQGASEEEE